jgi:hypothetical protein
LYGGSEEKHENLREVGAPGRDEPGPVRMVTDLANLLSVKIGIIFSSNFSLESFSYRILVKMAHCYVERDMLLMQIVGNC